VEAGVRIVTDVLLALVSGGVFGLLGGYMFGVLRTLNERRDAALAEIFKEMSLIYRSLVSWTDDPNADPNKPTPESSGIPVKTHVNDQFGKFARTFFDNAIWLGEDTYDLIKELVDAGRAILNELNSMRADGRLPDGTNPKDLREEQLTPKFYEVRDALRAEVEASRDILPFRREDHRVRASTSDTGRTRPAGAGDPADGRPVRRYRPDHELPR
jgi:hypothetical protein